MRLSLVLLIAGAFAVNGQAGDVNGIYARKFTTGCDQSNEGNVFYLAFMSNIPDQPKNVPVEIFVATAAETAQVTIECAGGHSESKAVTRNQVVRFQIPRDQIVHGENGKSTRSRVVKVSSDQKIVVYGANKEQYTTDAFLALPEHVIGTQYYAVTWFPPTNFAKPDFCQIALASTNVPTTVEITLPQIGGGQVGGHGYRPEDQPQQPYYPPEDFRPQPTPDYRPQPTPDYRPLPTPDIRPQPAPLPPHPRPNPPVDQPPPGAETIPFPPKNPGAGGFPFGQQRLADDLNIYAAVYVPPPYPGNGEDADGYYVPPPIKNEPVADLPTRADVDNVACAIEHEGRTYKNGETITIQLAALESFQLQAKCDLTGAYIRSSRPIAVFSGNARTAIGPGAITRDHLVEQLPPVPTWGRTFVTMPTPRRTVGDYIKIIASEDATIVNVAGRGVEPRQRTLNAGQQWLIDTPCQSYAYITASKPVLVVEFVKSQTVGTEPADPAMAIIMPIEQFGLGYTFNTVEGVATKYQNFLTIAVHRGKEHTLLLDGVPVQPSEGWTEIPGTNVTSGYLTINPGSHTISSQNGDTRFSTYVYGAGDRESYFYPTGMCLKLLTCPSTPGCCCQRCERGLGLF